MQRFFFDTEIDGMFVQDRRGLDLPDLESARDEAEHCVRDRIAHRFQTGEDFELEVMHVRDELGRCICRLPYAAYLRGWMH